MSEQEIRVGQRWRLKSNPAVVTEVIDTDSEWLGDGFVEVRRIRRSTITRWNLRARYDLIEADQ